MLRERYSFGCAWADAARATAYALLPAAAFLLLNPTARCQSTSGAITITGSPLTMTVPGCFSAGSAGSAKQNIAFNCALSASGGASPYTFSKVSGSFSAGINDVTAAGLVAGTPTGTTAGTEVVKVCDAASTCVQASITITPASLSSIAVTPAGAAVLTNQSIGFTALGTWSDGSVTDLSAVATWSCTTTCGSFSGNTFTAGSSAGSATIKAQFNGVTDDGGSGVSLTVGSVAPVIVTASLPHAQNGQPYAVNTCMVASGGTPPYSWTTTAGSLFGVTLGAGGCFSGSATSAGSNTVTFQVTDNASNVVTKGISFTSASVSTVSVTPASPSVNAGATQQMQATANYSDSSMANVTVGNALGISIVGNASDLSGTSLASLTSSSGNVVPGILAGVCRSSGSTITNTPSDTLLNTWHSVAQKTNANLGQQETFWAENTQTGADAFKCTYSSSTPYDFVRLIQITGGAAATPVDVHGEGTSAVPSTTTTLQTSAAITTTNLNDIVLAEAGIGTAATLTPGTGFTALDKTLCCSMLEYQILSSTVTETPSATYTSPITDWIINAVALKAAAAAGATWTSSNPACATINGSGFVTALPVVAQCTTTIQATYSGQNGTQTLTVNPATLQSIAVTPNPATAVAGGSPVQMTATGTYAGGGQQNITTTAAWSSSNGAVATVNSSGLVTPVAQGGANITATVGSVSGSAALTVSQSGTFSTYFRSDFEGNPTPNPCPLTTNPNSNVGPGDVGAWSNVNVNQNSCADTRHTDVSGHTGVAHSGFASALDFHGSGTTPGNFAQLDGTLTNGGMNPEIWFRVWFYISPTWVDCSQASQPCNQGAQHMFRWYHGDANHPYFAIGLPVQGDVLEGGATCGQLGTPYCNAGGNSEVNPLGSWRISTHAGAWHCLEMHLKANTPGNSDGLMEWFIDGSTSRDGGQFNLNIFGTHAFDGIPLINAGSQIGGSTGGTGYPLNSNYFYADDVAVTSARSGCSVP